MGTKLTALPVCCAIMIVFATQTVCRQDRVLVEPGEERFNARQPPDKVLEAIGVKPGMVIGEIGAGRGRYTVQFASSVGADGLVYANDIDRNALDYLERRCKRIGFNNVQTILGEVSNPKLPENSLDIAFMISTFHHLDDPIGLLRNTAPALKTEGRLIIVEYDPDKPGASPGSSTSKTRMREILEEAGFELIRIEEFLPLDNVYIARAK